MVINWGTFLLLFVWGLLIMNMWHTSSAGLSNAPTNLLIGKLWSFVAISIFLLLFLDGTIWVCQIGGNGGFLTAHANCGNYGKYPSHPIPTHVIAFTFISSHPIPSLIHPLASDVFFSLLMFVWALRRSDRSSKLDEFAKWKIHKKIHQATLWCLNPANCDDVTNGRVLMKMLKHHLHPSTHLSIDLYIP